ncbi:hypothetical protein [Streptomyces hainanensis]|uniref:DUF2304 domain-containing protein n=1 Tax=Streptomyces hainanensis TaxID=402648 RepID=A0A4R4TC03_9ACTN|nr:hypothetical protein [Streptomyces hainanensis]TDC74800.1 hypothetical protein E1283_14520 [Streptomyces hainanensis]
MFLSISAVVLVGAAIYALWRFGRLAMSHAALCTLFGFLLASSSLAPYINATIQTGAEFIAGLNP